MPHTHLATRLSLAALTMSLSSFTFAADISHSLRHNTQFDSEPENYFELGLALVASETSTLTKEQDEDQSGVGIVVNGSYNWRGFFIDLFGESQTPLVIGYNAYNSSNWSLDLLLTPTGNGVSEEEDDRFIGLDERRYSTMFGGRATGYLAGNTIQLSVHHDISEKSHGTFVSALIGRNWQYRNWNVHGMAGVNYLDANFVDYYLGVSAEEVARTNFSEYTGKSEVGFTAEVGVTYPVSEDWVFRTTARYGRDIGDDSSSPLLFEDRKDAMSFVTSLSYVF